MIHCYIHQLPDTHIVAGEDAVEELQRAHDGEKYEKNVEKFRPLGRLGHVVVVNVPQDLVPVGRARSGLGLGHSDRHGAGCRGANLDRRGGGRRGLAGVLPGRHSG